MSNITPLESVFVILLNLLVHPFEFELLTTDGLRKLVNDIPRGNADGLNGIPTCLLKLSFTFIASSLTHISN